ncbi:hypothetical protein [Lacticaseibacillus absianus]|uniref:hypothetical protein n=1 Tax=Lacticaseibacillus absianus TaxID=2729623 RepID=UPI0015C81E47|nr:hypothetical protein [Lacticaseibacillus absianus]
MKVTHCLLVLSVLGGIGAGLSGCGVGQTPASTGSSTAAVKTPKDYMAGLDARSLAANDQAAVAVRALPAAVAATSGVTFKSASDVQLTLLQFSTQAKADQAKAYYVAQGAQTYTDRKLLLVADRQLAKGWFEKYRSAIFKQ